MTKQTDEIVPGEVSQTQWDAKYDATTKALKDMGGVDAKDADDLPEGTTNKYLEAVEKAKLADVEKGARDLRVISDWLATTAYALDDLVVPTTPNGYKYLCTIAGTSAATEPTWPTTEGATIVDGTVTWTCYKFAATTVDADKLVDGVTQKVYSATEKTKLTSIEDSAKDDQTGAEVRDLVVALGDTERKIVLTEPLTGEFKLIGIHRNAAGNLEYDYDDVAES